MHAIALVNRFVLAALLCTLAACGGGGETPPPAAAPPPVVPPAPPPPGTLIGAAGGTVTGPNGAKVLIPAGALTTDLRINIELITTGAPALPTGFTAYGPMFAFTPHGTTFALPVTVTLPFDPGAVPAGATPVFYKTTNAQTQWEQISNATFGASSVSAQVTSFSDAEVVIPPLAARVVTRDWALSEMRNVGGGQRLVKVAGQLQEGGILSEQRDFGIAFIDSGYVLVDGTAVPRNGIANGVVGSSEDGKSFQVLAEAPVGNSNIDNDLLGSEANLVQTQSFIKRAADATLTFTMPIARIETNDKNAILHRLCPTGIGFCNPIQGALTFELEAMTHDFAANTLNTFYHVKGSAFLFGFADHWQRLVVNDSVSLLEFWSSDDFDFVIEDLDGLSDSHALLTLRAPRTLNVDISSIPVGAQFHIRMTAVAAAYNRFAGPPSEFATSAGAYMNVNPPGSIIAFAGLEPIASPPLPDPPPAVLPPAVCLPGPGPNPAAGTLQFSAPSYSIEESDTVPTITVTRVGGNTGAVTVNFSTSDGTAVAGVDYDAVARSVFFADGDSAPRVVEVPVIEDTIGGEPNVSVNLTLSQPGGCAALGTPSTAVLTIVDDDPRPPLPSGLDTTFGDAGKASFPAFGGDRSAMALQADGKIVMVGGTFTDFVLARFLANGNIDSAFGNAGKVVANIVSGEQEEALGVAIQPDGNIVVVGYTGQAVGPSVIALARYLPTGEVDTTFGIGGEVVSTVIGRAFAVALDTRGPELKIVVAGDDPNAEDMVLARFNANGTLDTGFGNQGHLTVNVAGSGDIASNIVLLPTGFILVSGGSSTGLNNTGLARFDPNGVLDSTFGSGGKLVLNGRRLGEGLALQSDGKIVLAGTLETAVSPATLTVFEVMRLTANGTPDSTFGTAGIVDTPVSVRGDAAFAVAVQPDGKIVAAGASSIQANANFAVTRYDTHGVLDSAFGNGTGMLTVDFFGSTDVAESVAVQPDGKIVAGGLARDNVDGYGVVRINP